MSPHVASSIHISIQSTIDLRPQFNIHMYSFQQYTHSELSTRLKHAPTYTCIYIAITLYPASKHSELIIHTHISHSYITFTTLKSTASGVCTHIHTSIISETTHTANQAHGQVRHAFLPHTYSYEHTQGTQGIASAIRPHARIYT